VTGASRTVALGDHQLTRIGLGTNRLANTSENRSFLEAAVEAGVSFIDTAHLYAGGGSESAIGQALAPFTADVVVASKAGYNAGTDIQGLRSEIEASFERLRTETITLYYLHRDHPDVPLEEKMALLKGYRDGGRITHVGLSQVGVEQIKRAQAIVPIAAVQNSYNLSDRGYDEVIDHCEAEGLVFVPFYPLGGGSSSVVEAIAARRDATPSQIQLAWLLHRSPVVAPIPGTLSLDHLRENLAALDIELSEDEFQALSESG
jgi:pyridoxine 4-dehydrogenase